MRPVDAKSERNPSSYVTFTVTRSRFGPPKEKQDILVRTVTTQSFEPGLPTYYSPVHLSLLPPTLSLSLSVLLDFMGVEPPGLLDGRLTSTYLMGLVS